MTHSPTPSRREILTRTAAAAGVAGLGGSLANAAGLAPARVAKKGRSFTPVADDEPIRIAVIGVGGMGNGHLDGLLRARSEGAEKLDVVAVSDVCLPRLERAQKKCAERQDGVEVSAHRDYKEIVERDDIHGVLVASPEHWHATMAVDCIMAGKDVYVEKPMTLRLDDALWLKRVVDANDQRLQVGTQYMMDVKYGEARRLIKEGAIGKPTLSQTSYCRNTPAGEWTYYGIDESVVPGEMLDWEAWCGPNGLIDFNTYVYHRWRRYRKWSTGILGDLLVHQMTPLIHALDLGFPVRVTGSGGHYVDKAMENHDQVLLTVEFEDDHTMIVAGSTINDRGLPVTIRGHEGDLLLGGKGVELVPQAPFVDYVDPQQIDCRGGDWQNELRLNWMSCIRSREMNQSTVDLGLKHMVAVDLGTRSLWSGQAQAFDPATLEASAI
ncbi:MAG: Gfo/Idh/MocA family protein [Planctomycetota bacterium]|jgi:predicted dehydrogenase